MLLNCKCVGNFGWKNSLSSSIWIFCKTHTIPSFVCTLLLFCKHIWQIKEELVEDHDILDFCCCLFKPGDSSINQFGSFNDTKTNVGSWFIVKFVVLVLFSCNLHVYLIQYSLSYNKLLEKTVTHQLSIWFWKIVPHAHLWQRSLIT